MINPQPLSYQVTNLMPRQTAVQWMSPADAPPADAQIPNPLYPLKKVIKGIRVSIPKYSR